MDACTQRGRGSFLCFIRMEGLEWIAKLFLMGDKPTKALADSLKFARGATRFRVFRMHAAQSQLFAFG